MRARRVLAVVLAALGVVLLGIPSAGAEGLDLRGPNVVALAVAASQSVVGAGAAEAVVLVAEDAGAEQFAAAAAVGGLPANTSVLVASADRLPPAVADELRRVTVPSAVVVTVGAFGPRVHEALAGMGLAVVDVIAAGRSETSIRVADASYGAAAGTDRRVVLVPGSAAAVGSAAAAVAGVNLAVPVVVGGGALELDALLRQVAVVGSLDDLPDPTGLPGDPEIVRIHETDPVATALALAEFIGSDPRDGDLGGPDVVAPVVVRVDDAAALLPAAATVAGRRSLDGFQAPLLLTDDLDFQDAAGRCDAGDEVACVVAAAEGPVTTLALLGTRGAPAAADAPWGSGAPNASLPTTGGGALALGVALLLLAAPRRSR
jgi:hypothetical protein